MSIFQSYLELANSVTELGKDLGFTSGEPEDDTYSAAADEALIEELDRENPEYEEVLNDFSRDENDN